MSLIEKLSGRPWAIDASLYATVREVVEREGFAGLRAFAELKRVAHAPNAHLQSRRLAMDDHDDDAISAARPAAPRAPQGIGYVPIMGTITQRGDYIDSAQTRSADAIASEVAAFAADAAVDSIFCEFDSPGGEVFGIAEAWAAIRQATKTKPVIGHANSMSASAGYWLMSACSEIWVTPGGMVGSIGVYSMHRDVSKALEMKGEKWTFISAGKYKTEGNPAEPLTTEALAAYQGDVDRYYSLFTRDVARGRGVGIEAVRSGFGEGRMLGADAALAEKMVDRVGTLQEALKRASQLGREARRNGNAAAWQGTL